MKKFICPSGKVCRDSVTTPVAAELMGEDKITYGDHGEEEREEG